MTTPKPESDAHAAQDAPWGPGPFRARPLHRDAELTALILELEETRAALRRAREHLKLSRDEIKEAELEWHAAFDAELDLMFLYDSSYRLVRANRAYSERAGVSPEEVIGKPYWEVFPRLHGPLSETREDEASPNGGEVRLDSGEVFLSRSTPVHDKAGKYLCTLHILQDITGQKRVQTAYARNRLVLRMLSESLLEMAHASDEAQMMHTVCRALVEKYGYHLAWVGYVRRILGVPAIIRFGHDSEHPESFAAASAENGGDEHNPAVLAMRLGAPFTARNVLNDPQFAFLRKDAGQSGYNAVLALPLTDRGRMLAVLCIYAVEPFAFETDEVRLLESLAADIVFGATAFRVRAEHSAADFEREAYLVRSRRSLESALEALVTAMELRCTRNARHQSRVGELSLAIATEMGLPMERARGVSMAGLLHDIGEIHVPDEIFSKPEKLTDEEWAEERRHPRLGYDMLKDIDFPWPVAQAVLQHHERFDGSGYPDGLKGDEILIEARIVALADGIVSMALEQHPHRPRLGLPAALAEVERRKGTRYDPAVVDTALALFLEKGCVIA